MNSDLKDAFFCCLRVHEGGFPYSDRIRGDGIRRFLCETHIYSHQQHHCWIRLGKLYSLIDLNIILFYYLLKVFNC